METRYHDILRNPSELRIGVSVLDGCLQKIFISHARLRSRLAQQGTVVQSKRQTPHLSVSLQRGTSTCHGAPKFGVTRSCRRPATTCPPEPLSLQVLFERGPTLIARAECCQTADHTGDFLATVVDEREPHQSDQDVPCEIV